MIKMIYVILITGALVIYLLFIGVKMEIKKQEKLRQKQELKRAQIQTESIMDLDVEFDYDLEVVGVTYDNPDGTSRQSILEQCNEADDVEIKWVPINGYPNALEVSTAKGCIGYISERDNKEIVKQLKKGATIDQPYISSLEKNKRGIIDCYVSFTLIKKAPTSRS